MCVEKDNGGFLFEIRVTDQSLHLFRIAWFSKYQGSGTVSNKDFLSRALAVGGTVLVWLPLLAPLFLGAVSYVTDGVFRFDYLMPAELFLVVLIGGGLLVWAAQRSGAYLAPISAGMAVAIVALIAAQGTAVLTGLASGETAVGGWQWALALLLLAVYWLAVAFAGVMGIALLRELFGTEYPRLEQ
jgi:hypothetical protein